jgi:hypothetical protein
MARRNILFVGAILLLLTGIAPEIQAASPQTSAPVAEPSPPRVPQSLITALYGTDKISDQMHLPPTTMSLMPYRHLELRYALAGYLRSKMPLVAFDGTKYFKAGNGDDPGMYYFVPRLAAFLNLPLERAIDLFLGTILILSFGVGAIGLMVLIDRWPLKLWALFGLSLLLWFSFRKGDIYTALSAPAVAVVPWLLYLRRRHSASAIMAAFLCGAGFVAGFANQVRGQAATGLMIFAAILVAFELKRGWVARCVLLAALAAGFLVSVVHFDSLLARRDAFLAASQPGYTQTVDRHSVWHAFYIGLGYLKGNPYVPGYGDEVALQAVYSISPSTIPLSPEYESILRGEIFRIAREHPTFIAATLVAKLRVILFLLLCWANFGLLAAAFYPKGWAMESAFWAALGFNALFGLIAIPQVQYLLGFMAFAMIYGVVSLDWAFGHNRPGEIHARFRARVQRRGYV